MSNMSYTRWTNTAGDMSDCLDAMREFCEPDLDSCNDNEASGSAKVTTKLEALSTYERDSLLYALKLAAEMLEMAGDNLLAEAGVDLASLA